MFRSIFFVLALLLTGSCKLSVQPNSKQSLMVRVSHNGQIIKVPIESYVASVLAGEVPSSWPLEALKAQAVAARTYVLKRMKERKNAAYHVQSTVMDQVYRPSSEEIFKRASYGTRGAVLTINGHLAETLFHSTCGGKTAPAQEVFGHEHAHLQSHNCGYCEASPTYDWTTEIQKQTIEAKYGMAIKSIAITSRFSDGRINHLTLIGSRTIRIKAHDFRMAVSPMTVKSTRISTIKVLGDTVVISGRGFGHGVGMCQYGAMGMAKEGRTFLEILSFYYPKTQIKRAY